MYTVRVHNTDITHNKHRHMQTQTQTHTHTHTHTQRYRKTTAHTMTLQILHIPRLPTRILRRLTSRSSREILTVFSPLASLTVDSPEASMARDTDRDTVSQSRKYPHCHITKLPGQARAHVHLHNLREATLLGEP